MEAVLLVEDDLAIGAALQEALEDLGHVVTLVRTGGDALGAVRAQHVDVVVLDLGLPDLDGREVLLMLRAISDVAVIVATARDGEQEIVRVLDAGADDYVVKPFSARQLDARMAAVLRRSRGPAEEWIAVGGLALDARRREARLEGRSLALSRLEFDLLLFLARHRDRVVGKRELLVSVWRQNAAYDDRTVDVHLSWLRQKLGETAAQPRYLQRVRGVGVRLVDPTA